MTARELIELLAKAPDANVKIITSDVLDHQVKWSDPLEPTNVTLNPEANAWIIEP